MAAFQGYQCEFIDSVFDDLYCKKCTLVARRLSITTCCGESFCRACIADTKEEGKPCPACGEEDYNTVEHVKNQRRIKCHRVYCNMKEKGCDWSGTLEQLDTHLDPDQDNCQYVDTKCPLNCHMTIPKNKVEQHVAQHCAKRPYVCQYCNFKATYEEVVDEHLPECQYIPLQCPNMCGVTFEREFMEDHMKMCHLEKVGCEFSGVGCDDWFQREDQEEHTRQNSQKHLTLTASLAVETKEQLQQKLLEHDKKHNEVEENLMKKIEELEKKLNEQEKLIHQDNERKLKQKIEELHEVQKQKLDKQKELLEKQFNSKLRKLEDVLIELVDKSIQNEGKFSKLFSMTGLNRRFEMKNFSDERAKETEFSWKSPAMYTHVCGYKFCIGVDANGYGHGSGKAICVDLYSMPGKFDDQLKWPAKAMFTIELINQQEGENASDFKELNWEKPSTAYYYLGSFYRILGGFLEHSKLMNFLFNDTLSFNVDFCPSYVAY